MKQYRYKNKKEFEREYGSEWREIVDFPPSMDCHLGEILPLSTDVLLDESTKSPWAVNIHRDHLVEIPQLSCDIQKVYFSEEKGSVTVILRNGNEGKAKCSPEDTYDPYVGFAVAYARAVAGSTTKLRKYIDTRLYGRKGGKKEEVDKEVVQEVEKKKTKEKKVK